MPVKIYLKDPDATLELGQILAKALSGTPNPPALLLQGELGAGKTTLVRGLVESLQDSDRAEVSSPSFNIFNLYPTVPPVAHFDLYRLEGMPPDDALMEHLEDLNILTIVEWIQFLDKKLWPREAIYLKWSLSETGRSLVMHAMGETAKAIVEKLLTQLKHFK